MLRTSLSPSESRASLEAAGERDGVLAEISLSYGILVHVQGGRVWLRVRRPFVNNPLSPWLLILCRPSPNNGGALVDMSVRYEPLSIAFAVTIGLFVVLLAGGMFPDLLSGRGHNEPGSLLPLLFCGLVLAWIPSLTWLGRRDLHALIQFATKTLAASPIHGLTSRLSSPA
jgi:hypothetical protein